MALVATVVHCCGMSILPLRRQSGRQSKMGCLTRLVLVLVVACAALAGAMYLFAPWAYYMGGRFHWFPMWQGVGRLHSNSGGGDYAFYLYFYPKSTRWSGLRHVDGRAQ